MTEFLFIMSQIEEVTLHLLLFANATRIRSLMSATIADFNRLDTAI